MAASSTVTTGDIATAAQYNDLRTDVLDSSSSHTHAGTSNTGVKVNSNNLQGTVLASTVVTSSLTTVGTIATGVWQGTDVGVAYGGTGVSTLTDGGVLLGSGASAITAMAVLADSEMIVGDGSTDPVAESGATLRTSIGVGTGDSLTFADLTVSKAGANQVEVISTANDAYLILNSDTDEGQDSEVIFESGGTARGRIEYNHNTTAASQVMSFFTGDNAVQAIDIMGDGNVGIGTSAASLYNPLTVLKDATLGFTVISDTSHTEYAGMGATADYAHFYGGSGQSATVGMKFYTTISGSEANSMILSGGISPTLQLGVASTADSKIIFDTNSTDYHIGWGVDEDDLIIGFGATLGTTPVISVSPIGNGRVTIGKQQETATHGLLYLNPDTVTVGANKPYHYLYMSNNNVITIPSGTASLVTAMNIEIPNITATGTVTQTATVRIAGAMSEGTTDYALFVDAGTSRFDGDVIFNYDNNASPSGGETLLIGDAGGYNRIAIGSDYLQILNDDDQAPYSFALASNTPLMNIGGGSAVDAMILFDGHAVDYHIGLDDTADLLVFGTGTTLGSNVSFAMDSTGGRGIYKTSTYIGGTTAYNTTGMTSGRQQTFVLDVQNVAASATIDIVTFNTASAFANQKGVVVEGWAQDGTSAIYFRVVASRRYGGDTSVVLLDQQNFNTTSWMATGDWTVADVSGDDVKLSYTNNEAGTVAIQMNVRVFG